MAGSVPQHEAAQKSIAEGPRRQQERQGKGRRSSRQSGGKSGACCGVRDRQPGELLWPEGPNSTGLERLTLARRVCRSITDDKPSVPQGPASFYCPVSMELMSDPVMVATGHSYDRSCIQKWLEQGNRTCPVTGLRLRHLELTPNIALRNAIQVSNSSSS